MQSLDHAETRGISELIGDLREDAYAFALKDVETEVRDHLDEALRGATTR